MEEYNILNTIKPKFLRTKYPYNLVSPEKIMLTQKKITIMAKELSPNQSKSNPNKGKFGGSIHPQITFYG
jgi:hypothetical protein